MTKEQKEKLIKDYMDIVNRISQIDNFYAQYLEYQKLFNWLESVYDDGFRAGLECQLKQVN